MAPILLTKVIVLNVCILSIKYNIGNALHFLMTVGFIPMRQKDCKWQSLLFSVTRKTVLHSKLSTTDAWIPGQVNLRAYEWKAMRSVVYSSNPRRINSPFPSKADSGSTINKKQTNHQTRVFLGGWFRILLWIFDLFQIGPLRLKYPWWELNVSHFNIRRYLHTYHL